MKLVRVTDARKFALAPPVPSIPSLKDAEIGNPAITTRAIARKRNSYGKALGDILLEEGDSVPQLVTDVIQNPLREAGYRVLEAGEAGFETAAPLARAGRTAEKGKNVPARLVGGALASRILRAETLGGGRDQNS